MKKFIYIILLSITSSLTFTSCTEEKVEPASAQQPPLKGAPSEEGY